MARFLDALKCQNRDIPPIWFMRQAGRYFPAFKRLREKYSLYQLFRSPELVLEVTLQPIEAYGFDAAILFADILLIVEAMGFKLDFVTGKGPVIDEPLRRPEDLTRLSHTLSLDAVKYVFDSIQLLRKHLSVPLIGFCGGPFTVVSYLIEGGSSNDFANTRKWMYAEPEALKMALRRVTDWTIAYLYEQVASGAQAIQIFESHAHLLSYSAFADYAHPYLKEIVQAMRKTNVPVIVFGRGMSSFIPELVEMKPACVSFDTYCDLLRIRKALPASMAIQGNLDPWLLQGSDQMIEREIKRLMEGLKGDPGFVFGLGHGVLQQTPPEKIGFAVACARQYATQLIKG